MPEIIEELSHPIVLQKISDICTSVNIVKNNRELLEVSLKKTMELLGARRGSIFIFNKNKQELILKTACGMKTYETQNLVKRLGEGVVGQVAQIKKPLVVEDISKDIRFQNFKARSSYRTPSFICAPLLIKDTLIGVINIADKESGGRFTKNELQLLDFLSSQIALNYRRIQLYQKFRSIVQESKTLKTELGKSNAEAHHLKKQIIVQEKFASIGKLAGGIAHEFNNPLDGVIRYTNLSLEHLKDDDVVRGYLLEVKHGLNRMVNIVRSLLACSRNSKPTMQEIDVHLSIEQVISSVSSEILHKNISLKKNFDAHIPKITDLGIELVIANLLRNAIDAVDRNGNISITTKFYDNQVKIQMSDSGCGFASDLAEKIFEPFYTTKDIDKGCGLGLTIVHEIIKSYNGKIDIKSAPQKGSTFTVFIPVSSKT